MEYEELLKRAMEKVPKKAEGAERFEVPEVDTVVQGNQTIIKNFGEVLEKLRRESKHLMKYLTKELAAPGSTDGTRATFQGRFAQRVVQGKLENYVKEYVICKVCSKPDTRLVKEGRIEMMKCEACGARSSVRKM